MTDEENLGKRIQRTSRDSTRKAKEALKPFKKKFKEKTNQGFVAVKDAYNESEADKFMSPKLEATQNAAGKIKESVIKFDAAIGISSTAIRAKEAVSSHVVKPTKGAVSDHIIEPTKEAVSNHVIRPTKGYLTEAGISVRFTTASNFVQDAYGNTRRVIKPYFAPESTIELLDITRKELTGITACILQISRKNAENWMGQFGKLVSAKVAGIAGTATLFSLVSTFGTAGTGTAIASLSGTAQTSATIAALGFGGGMATGALVLGGFGFAVGMLTYKYVLSSKPRDYETLPKEDKQIVNTCVLLAAAIEGKLKERSLKLYADEALKFREALDALHKHLKENTEIICENLSAKKSLSYRKHILIDFEFNVLNHFDAYIDKTPFSPAGIVSGVFYALLTRSALDGSQEQELVLEALRRSNNDLHDASESELSDYLHDLTPEQQRGVANNVKGIYHELKYVQEYNNTHEETYAELHSSTNHEGSDVIIKSKETGEVIAEYQLKATDSQSYVREHQERYPDIEVRATEEVAAEMDGVESSGEINLDLSEDVDTVFIVVEDNTMTDRIIESGEYTGLAAAGLEAINMLQGKSNLSDAGKRTLRASASAAAAAGITAFLFG